MTQIDTKFKTKAADKKECLSCKVIAYGTTLSLLSFGILNLPKRPLPYSILTGLGLAGIYRLLSRDI